MASLSTPYFIRVCAPCWFKYTFISVPSGGQGNYLFVICIIILERRLPSGVTDISQILGLFHMLFFTFHCQWIIDWSCCFAKSRHCSERLFLCQHPRKHPHAFTLSDSPVFCHMHLYYLSSLLFHTSLFPPLFLHLSLCSRPCGFQ